MNVGKICDRRIPTAAAHTTVLAAAKTMHAFGDPVLVIAEERAGRRVALGVVTEHELVGVMVNGEDPSQLAVADIMIPAPPFVGEAGDVLETLLWMRRNHLHEAIVHDNTGALLGMVSLDQLADNVAGELSEVAAYDPANCAVTAPSGLH